MILQVSVLYFDNENLTGQCHSTGLDEEQQTLDTSGAEPVQTIVGQGFSLISFSQDMIIQWAPLTPARYLLFYARRPSWTT
jgi:hypothetical protein